MADRTRSIKGKTTPTPGERVTAAAEGAQRVESAEWQRIKELFDAAVQLPTAERGRFLEAACSDQRMRREVELLLGSLEEAGSFLESPAVQLPNDGANDQLIGKDIGAYRIVREVGRGGMGAVYLAVRADEQYQRQVAIKLVKRGMDTDSILRRFRNERQILANLDHTHIARLFDGGTTDDGLPYFTMEYIEGKTILDYGDCHRLSIQERLRLFLDICSAVHYAHQKLVVHRDLKPSNILVTQDGTVKLLDFGVAKLLNADLSSMTLEVTAAGLRVMTLEYASPEQVRGDPVTPASDIYSLGVLLYELLAGHHPYKFKSREPNQLLRVICEFEPEPPSRAVTRVEPIATPDGLKPITPESVSLTRGCDPGQLRRSLKGDLDDIVLRALRKEPEARYRSAAELADDLKRHLENRPVQARSRTWRYLGARFLRRHRAAVLGTAAALCVLLAGVAAVASHLEYVRFLVLRWTGPQISGAAELGLLRALAKPRRSFVVVGFKNLAGKSDAAWLSTALAEMFTTELAVGDDLRAIAGENVARMKFELGLKEVERFGNETLGRIRTNLGSDLVVVGSYFALGEAGGRIRLDLHLQDAATGETLASVTDSESLSGIPELVSRVGAKVRERLGIGSLSRMENGEVRLSLPRSPEAARLYAEGLAKLREFNALEARDLLEKSIRVEPDRALTHAALASAWSALHYDRKAQAEASLALDLSGQLGREGRLLVEGLFHETSGKHEKAVDVYRTLFSSFPDNVDYGLELVSEQVAVGKGASGLTTVEALRRLPPQLSEDPRIDLAEAAAAESVSDFKREQAAAERAAAKATATGARLLVARAQLRQGIAVRVLGDWKRALALFEQSRRTYSEVGDRGSTALADNAIGGVLSKEGRQPARALEMQTALLAVFRELGDRAYQARTLSNIASALVRLERWPEAKAKVDEALQIAREVGDKKGELGALNVLGIVLRSQAKWPEARKAAEDALAIARDSGDKREVVTALSTMANLLSDQGEPEQALELDREALAISRIIDDKPAALLMLTNIAIALKHHGELSEAKKVHEQALAIDRQLNDERDRARVLNNLANLLVDQGNLQAAHQNYDEALAIRRRLGDKGGNISTLINLADVLTHQGELGEAQRRLEEAEALSLQAGDKRPLFRKQFMLARILLYRAQFSEARQQYQQSLAIRSERHDNSGSAATRFGLAWVDLEEGQLERAETEARELTGVYRNMPDQMAMVLGLMARSLRQQGKLEDARSQIERAQALAGNSQFMSTRLQVGMEAARIRAASGKADQIAAARESLRGLIREATSAGYVPLQLHLRLALAEIAVQSGAPGGRAELDAVAKEAEKKGFLLYARQALQR